MSHDPNSPEVLISVETEMEAAMIVTFLAEQGLEASTTGDHTAGFRAEAPGLVNVIVRYSDLKQAQSALSSYEQEKPEIDWSQVDVGQPED